MLKRYDNIIIYKLFFRSKKIIKVILSSITRIELIICIEDPKEASGVDYAYIKDTKVKEITIINIVITGYSVRSNIISIINLNTN